MKISSNIEEVIASKKAAIRFLNNTLEFYITDSKNQNLKKVQLLSKWLTEFSNYIRFEEKFEASKNIAYKRGDIIKANFGFNVGSELGGVHYAIVIDNNNKHNADTVTVIPLSSYKPEKAIYERDLFIGSEFYNLLYSRTKKMLLEAKAEALKASQMIEILIKHADSDPEVEKLIPQLKAQKAEADKKTTFGKKCFNELSMMKNGSIVKLEQIRTISKMRILDPKKTHDVLYGIHLSDTTMDKINEKLKELFCH